MSDNFDRKVCHELGLDNTNLAQPITNQCFILFSLWCKRVTLAIKEKTLQQNRLRSKCLNYFPPHLIKFTGNVTVWRMFGFNMSVTCVINQIGLDQIELE